MSIIKLTKDLKCEVEKLNTLYEAPVEAVDRTDRMFFERMKAETEPKYELIKQWENSALAKGEEDIEFIGVYPHQIQATKDIFEILIIHSYYKDVDRNKYKEISQSCLYVFDQLLRAVNTNQ